MLLKARPLDFSKALATPDNALIFLCPPQHCTLEFFLPFSLYPGCSFSAHPPDAGAPVCARSSLWEIISSPWRQSSSICWWLPVFISILSPVPQSHISTCLLNIPTLMYYRPFQLNIYLGNGMNLLFLNLKPTPTFLIFCGWHRYLLSSPNQKQGLDPYLFLSLTSLIQLVTKSFRLDLKITLNWSISTQLS